MATKVKTGLGDLKYVFIKGEGRNQALKGEAPRMQFVASLVTPKDGPVHKAFDKLIMTEWDDYKKSKGVKGLPKTNGIKDEMMKDPSGEIDPATEEVKKVPTGNVIIGFKTNTTWPDGKPQVVKVFDHKGTDITAAYQRAEWSIGAGSTGVIHGTAVANDIGGSNKVTLYLTAVQIAKLSKYTGDTVETEELEGEDIDLGEDVSAIDDSSEGPAL